MRDPNASDVFYVNELAAPNTVNTMPAPTLVAFADHGKVGDVLDRNGGSGTATIAQHGKAGVDVAALGAKLQTDGANAFVELMEGIASGDRYQKPRTQLA